MQFLKECLKNNGGIMKEELISVIVPVYNVEKYISKCIESVKEGLLN